MRFEGKRAIVTGAAGDVGQLIVVGLLAEGARVLGVDRDTERGAAMHERLQSAGLPFEFRELDVTDADAIASVLGSERRVDVLINAVGVIALKPSYLSSAEEWDHVHAINVRSVFLIVKTLVGALSRQSSIVNISSVGGIKAESGFGAYSASKAGLIQLSKVLAHELAPHTRVNVIAPGGLDTQMPRKMLAGHPQADAIMAGVGAANLRGTLGRPEEVVPTVLLLASDESTLINGSLIVMDAGQTA